MATICSDYELVEDTVADSTYLESVDAGLAIRAGADGVVDAVFLFGDGKDGYQEYAGELPDGITFGSSRASVRLALGAPSASSDASDPTAAVQHGGWDRYDQTSHALHLSYRVRDGGVELVTIMPLASNGAADPGPPALGALIPVFIPSLVATLLRREHDKGRELLEREVIAIRDSAIAVMLPTAQAAQLDASRGYEDIDPENCWVAWRRARGQLGL